MIVRVVTVAQDRPAPGVVRDDRRRHRRQRVVTDEAASCLPLDGGDDSDDLARPHSSLVEDGSALGLPWDPQALRSTRRDRHTLGDRQKGALNGTPHAR